MEVTTFKRGDVVTLKSGGALFTVESEHTTESGEKLITCKYWNKKNEKVEKFEIFSDMVRIDNSSAPQKLTIQHVYSDDAPRIAESEEDIDITRTSK